jgi:hypothetical protein
MNEDKIAFILEQKDRHIDHQLLLSGQCGLRSMTDKIIDTAATFSHLNPDHLLNVGWAAMSLT